MPYSRAADSKRDVYLQARATVARRLIAEGRLDPYLGLGLVIWPTAELQAAEERCSERTINFRAYSTRQNP